jgi:RodZ C-terminal domain
MAGQTDQQSQTGTTPVPDLIERYRLRRDAWIAQADELARLRDEVRGSAEREAMEIVTAARRDVRKIIMEARRELLVLSAQVQAALGEATPKTDRATLLIRAGITPDDSQLALLEGAVVAFAPEDAVKEILNEVQEDMSALAEDARTLPLQAVPQLRQITAPPSPPSQSVLASSTLPASAIASSTIAPAAIAPPTFSTPLPRPSSPAPEPEISTLAEFQESIEISELNEAAANALLSSQFPSDAVPVQSGRRISAFVAACVGIGVVVAGITFWWLSNRDSGASGPAIASEGATPTAPSAVAPPTPQPGPADKAATPPAPSADAAGLSLVAEAVREVWVRTTIDGRTDGGRTLSAGQVIDVSAEKSISLRAGDGGALLFSLNRRQKQPLGESGQPVTRQFDAEKRETPQPAPAPQPAKPVPTAPPNARSAPPIALAAPAPPPSIPMPTTTASANAAQVANPPGPPMPTPAASPANAIASSQPAVSPGVVNQLSAPANSSAPVAVSPANVVLAIARQWLDAYHRQDRNAMAALSTDNLLLADERRPDERFPTGLSDVTRALDRVSVQIAADTAVLTAVMTEQSVSQPSPHVSPISQVWVLGEGQWKVRQARFVSEARLNQVFR